MLAAASVPTYSLIAAITFAVLCLETMLHHLPHFVEHRRERLSRRVGEDAHDRLVEFRMFDGYVAHALCFSLACAALKSALSHPGPALIWVPFAIALGVCFCVAPIAFKVVRPNREHDVARDRQNLQSTKIGKFALNSAAMAVFVFGLFHILGGVQ